MTSPTTLPDTVRTLLMQDLYPDLHWDDMAAIVLQLHDVTDAGGHYSRGLGILQFQMHDRWNRALDALHALAWSCPEELNVERWCRRASALPGQIGARFVSSLWGTLFSRAPGHCRDAWETQFTVGRSAHDEFHMLWNAWDEHQPSAWLPLVLDRLTEMPSTFQAQVVPALVSTAMNLARTDPDSEVTLGLLHTWVTKHQPAAWSLAASGPQAWLTRFTGLSAKDDIVEILDEMCTWMGWHDDAPSPVVLHVWRQQFSADEWPRMEAWMLSRSLPQAQGRPLPSRRI